MWNKKRCSDPTVGRLLNEFKDGSLMNDPSRKADRQRFLKHVGDLETDGTICEACREAAFDYGAAKAINEIARELGMTRMDFTLALREYLNRSKKK